MAWRTVDGVEYLTRYTQVDGKKQARSLGRRSSQTEAQMEQFEKTVLRARRTCRRTLPGRSAARAAADCIRFIRSRR